MLVDFKKTLESFKARKGKFSIIDIPPMQYLMVDGHSTPSEREPLAAIQALYPVAYKLKFWTKQKLEQDYVVPPLEGLWWADDMEVFTTKRDKSLWAWTMMILTPDWITLEMFESVVLTVHEKKDLPEFLDKVRLKKLEEGKCVQKLHAGFFDDEGTILEQMHTEFIPKSGFKMTGKHHEVYLSDFKKVAPEKLRTILRQPVEKLN